METRKTAKLKLYRHYKNKPYKYIGRAVHSESLEELALYETRYDNELSSLWVRPKNMFFSDIEADGRMQPRFKQVPIEIEMLSEVDEQNRSRILELLRKVSDGYSPKKFDSTLSGRKNILLATAEVNDQFVGFKLGYSYNNERFYSWLGAIDPDFRGIGLGKELINLQHAWCANKSFKFIETRTKNKWREMLLLNIQSGFEIIGTYTKSNGETKIILQKSLLQNYD